MSWLDRTSPSESEIPAIQHLFDRIVETEKDMLSDEQKAKPREYLLATWVEASEIVMRPLRRYTELEQQLRELQPDDGLPF